MSHSWHAAKVSTVKILHQLCVCDPTQGFPIWRTRRNLGRISSGDKMSEVAPLEENINANAVAGLVTELLRQIEGSNRGVDCSPQQRAEIDSLIEQLSERGEGTNWLADPRIYGNYNVAYASAGSSRKGNPAGGRWRGRVGRILFRTENLFQHLVAPATAVNMVVFKAFGLIPGCVTLRGDYEAIEDRPNFVKASFDPPILNFFGKRGVTIRSGPKSSVALSASYVDERVRIGKGGRGSLFIFTRGGAADTPLADMWKVYASESARPLTSKALGVAMALGALMALLRSARVPAGLLAWASAALLATRGGIIDGESPTS